MPLNQQTANFPPISQPERSWDKDLRAWANLLYPEARIAHGLQLGLPDSPGLLPKLTDGVLVKDDLVIGPFGSKLISAAPASVTRRGLYYGLRGMAYREAIDVDVTDALIGEVTTDATGIVSLVQYFYPSPGKCAVKGMLYLPKATTGSDVAIANVTMTNYSGLRITAGYSSTKEVAATTATGDQLLIKAGGNTVLTHNKAALDSGTGFAIASPGADQVQPDDNTLMIAYNSTQGTAFTAGAVGFYVEIEGLA